MQLQEIIRFWAEKQPNAFAIDTITYRELAQLQQEERAPFFAHPTLQTVLYFLQSKAPFPLSYRLPLCQAKKMTKAASNTTALLTSGSSGSPKIAKLTQENLYFSAKGAVEYFGLNPSDKFLLSLPFFHVGGLAIIWRALLAGAHLILPKSKDLSEEIKREKITRISLVPLQLQRLKEQDFPSLRTILLGGQAMPKNLGEYSLPLFISYGMTEMSSIIACAPWNREEFLQLMPYRKMKLSQDGEIWVAGKTLFEGYVGEDPIAGWFPTKDLGKYSKKGWQIAGRKDRQFISGGENIQPEEIESALLSIKGIEEAFVASRNDDEFGKRPIAYIAPFPVPDVKCQLEKLLPRFKIPDAFFPLQEQEKGAQLSRDLH